MAAKPYVFWVLYTFLFASNSNPLPPYSSATLAFSTFVRAIPSAWNILSLDLLPAISSSVIHFLAILCSVEGSSSLTSYPKNQKQKTTKLSFPASSFHITLFHYFFVIDVCVCVRACVRACMEMRFWGYFIPPVMPLFIYYSFNLLPSFTRR